MNKVKNCSFMLFFIIIISYLFKYNYIVNKSVIDSVHLWLTKVFPSLFIMFILNDIIINTNFLNEICIHINPLFNKIFNTDGFASEVFLLSIISGTPTSTYVLKESLDKNLLSTDTANKLISYTYFSNPLFLYNILSITFNKYSTIKIILIHYLTNIIIGLLYRGKTANNILNTNYNNNKNNIFNILTTSIKKSIELMVVILGIITFYMIITNLVVNIIPINNTISIIIKGIMEITQGLSLLKAIKYPNILKEIIAIAIISFGGLSIHTQVYTLISDTSISFKHFFKGRILHVLIATILIANFNWWYMIFVCYV